MGPSTPQPPRGARDEPAAPPPGWMPGIREPATPAPGPAAARTPAPAAGPGTPGKTRPFRRRSRGPRPFRRRSRRGPPGLSVVRRGRLRPPAHRLLSVSAEAPPLRPSLPPSSTPPHRRCPGAPAASAPHRRAAPRSPATTPRVLVSWFPPTAPLTTLGDPPFAGGGRPGSAALPWPRQGCGLSGRLECRLPLWLAGAIS